MKPPWEEFEEVERNDLIREIGRLREALESLYDWQNGPPILKPSWLKGWNDAMEKAAELLGRTHERMDR